MPYSEIPILPTLLEAVGKNSISDVVTLLQDPQTNVNEPDSLGWTPLFIAALRGYSEIVNLLLSHPRIDVNMVNNMKQTPLYCAAFFGHPNLVTALLSHLQIDVHRVNMCDWTSLHVVQLLLEQFCESNLFQHSKNISKFVVCLCIALQLRLDLVYCIRSKKRRRISR